MPEVNEEIVKQYLESRGYFVKTDTKYLRSKERTGLKGSGWSDLDILATDNNGNRLLVEVKGWHTEKFAANYFRKGAWVDEIAKEEAAKAFGTKNFRTVLVVPALGSRSRKEALRLSRSQGIDKVWEFSDIIKSLIDHVQTNISYDSEVLQTVRLLKAYGFLK